MTYVSPFGQVAGRGQVATGVLSTLSTPPAGSSYPLFAWYVADVERQEGLPARSTPIPSVYHSGLDFETWRGGDLPVVICVAQPTGETERQEDGSYAQWFEIQLGALAQAPGDDEWVAQARADTYGAALMLAVAQNRSLGGLSIDTRLIDSPRTEFVDPTTRSIARSVVTFHSLVQQVVRESGPYSLSADPYTAPTLPPTVGQIDIGLTGESPLGGLSVPSGASVTDAAGHVLTAE